MAWSKRDLMLFAEGMAVGGKYNVAGMGGYSPRVWNDTSVYSYFYIDFLKPLGAFSIAQLKSSITVLGNKGTLTITNAKRVDTTIIKVYCDISTEPYGITVIGDYKNWLTYANGKSMPLFSAHFYVAGLINYTDAAYVYEPCELDFAPRLSTVGNISYTPIRQLALQDHHALENWCLTDESVTINYVTY